MPRALALVSTFVFVASASLASAAPPVPIPAPVPAARDAALDALYAAPPLKAPAEVLVRAAPTPLEADASSEILLSDDVIRYDAGQRATRTSRVIVRVLDAQGIEEWGTVRYDWAPWHEARPEVQARVVTADGRELALDPKTVSDAASRTSGGLLVDDRKELVVPLPGVGRGATIEIMITARAERPVYDAPGAAGRHYLFPSKQTRRARLRVEAPAAAKLVWRTRGFEARGLVLATGKQGDVQHLAVDATPGAWVPARAMSEVPAVYWSTGGTWQDMARAYHTHVTRALASPPPAKALPVARGDRRARAAAVLAAVQARVRYTGLELGQSAIVPYTPAEVWQREYGDCKDMAVLMVHGLAQSGVEARVALLDAGGGGDDIDPAAVGLDGFDHAIVYLPPAGGEPALWIDPTASGHPVGVLPHGDLERQALVIDPATTGLVATPARGSAPDVMAEDVVVTLAPLGDATVDASLRYEGTYAPFVREASAGKTPAQLVESYGWLGERHYGKVTAVRTESDAGSVTVRAKLEDAGRYVTGTHEIELETLGADLIEHLPDMLLEADPKDPPPYRFGNAVRYSTRVTFRAPPGFVVAAGLGTQTQELGPVRWSQAITKVGDDGRSVEVASTVELGKLDWTPDDVKAFVTARAAFTGAEHRIVLRHEAMTLVESGLVAEGLARFRAHFVKHPDDAATHARLAIVLADLCVPSAARAEVDKALALDPKNRMALVADGLVASADPLGRLLVPGWNRAAAIAAYERALAAHPKWPYLRMGLAAALERDADARLAKSGPDLDKAIAHYRALAVDDGHEPALDPYVQAAWRAGKLAELAADGPKLGDDGARQAFWLAAVALHESPEAALRAAARLQGATAQQSALETAVGALLLQRRYAEALALGRVTVARYPGATKTGQMLRLLPVVKPMRVVGEAKTPQDAVRAFMTTMAEVGEGGDIVAATRRFIAPGHDRGDADEGALGGFDSGIGVMSLGVDLALSLGTMVEDGDEASGYRVRLESHIGPKAARFETFWVRTPDGYRLVAAGHMPNELGERALILAARNELAGARRWLDWARELVAGGEGRDAFGFWEGLWPILGREVTRVDIESAAAALALLGPRPSEGAIAAVLRAVATWPTSAREVGLGFLVVRVPPEKLLTILAALPTRSPEEELLEAQVLGRAGRHAEVATRARAKLAIDPGASRWQMHLALAEVARGDLAAGGALLKKLVDAGQELFANEYAWTEAVRGAATDDVERYAQRAVAFSEKRGRGDASHRARLNTLAFVQLELGKLGEAAEAIKQSIPNGARLEPGDHLLLGRMAEALGYTAAAKEAYKRIPKHKGDDGPTSVWAVAQARLARLGR